jgi:uncharacterized protein (UPF0261 family)
VDWNPHGPIALIGTLDTKGTEVLFLKQRLAELGFESLVIDVGVLGPPAFTPDVQREEIAACAGTSVDDLAGGLDRGRAIAAMQAGLTVWVRERHARSPLAGVLAIGGSAGTSIAAAGMRELPTGLPKLMVSTVASGNTRPYVGSSDIAMLYPLADFSGLNRLTRRAFSPTPPTVLQGCAASRHRRRTRNLGRCSRPPRSESPHRVSTAFASFSSAAASSC